MSEYDTSTLHKAVCAHAKTSDNFYTPTDKAKLEQWLNQMPFEMPTVIALMVGVNYALHQMQQVANGTHPQMDQIVEGLSDDG